MESLNSLKMQLESAKADLEKITIKKHGSTPWGPGVLDQHKSNSYSYEEYTDVSKAHKLKDKITYLEHQIRTYGARAKAEREREEANILKFEYTSSGKEQTTTNPAIAARYNAQHRFFGMNKLQRSMATLSGQKRNFKKLWDKAITQNRETQEEVAAELNKLFR